MKRHHEPLRVPRGWTDQDRALVIQLNNLLDEVYDIQGKIETRIAELGTASNMDVANNLTTTDPGSVLDARQGPIINAMLSSLTGPAQEITEAINFNSCLTVGTYTIPTNAIAAACTNKPSNNAGRLIVWNMGNGKTISGSYSYGGQFYINYSGYIYSRTIKTGSTGSYTYGLWYRYMSPPSETTACTVASGYAADIFNVTRYGHSAHLQINSLISESTTATSWETVGTLPNTFAPQCEHYGALFNDTTFTTDGHTMYEVKILTNGDIQVWRPKANTKMWGGITFLCK